MMIGRHFIMNSWKFHVDKPTFSWWQIEFSMMTIWEFDDNKMKFLWWQVEIFLMAGRIFIKNGQNVYDGKPRFSWLQVEIFSVAIVIVVVWFPCCFQKYLFLTQHNVPFYVCLKSIALCNYRSQCCSSATLVQNIGEFGAKKHVTKHRTAKTFTVSRPQALRLWNIFEFLTCF